MIIFRFFVVFDTKTPSIVLVFAPLEVCMMLYQAFYRSAQ